MGCVAVNWAPWSNVNNPTLMTDVKGDGSCSDLEVTNTSNTKGEIWVGSELNPPFIDAEKSRNTAQEKRMRALTCQSSQAKLTDVLRMEVVCCGSERFIVTLRYCFTCKYCLGKIKM